MKVKSEEFAGLGEVVYSIQDEDGVEWYKVKTIVDKRWVAKTLCQEVPETLEEKYDKLLKECEDLKRDNRKLREDASYHRPEPIGYKG